MHGDLADPGGGERGHARQRQRLAGGGEHVAGADVLAAVADVEAVGTGGVGAHGAVVDLGALDLQHGVGARRQRRRRS